MVKDVEAICRNDIWVSHLPFHLYLVMEIISGSMEMHHNGHVINIWICICICIWMCLCKKWHVPLAINCSYCSLSIALAIMQLGMHITFF